LGNHDPEKEYGQANLEENGGEGVQRVVYQYKLLDVSIYETSWIGQHLLTVMARVMTLNINTMFCSPYASIATELKEYLASSIKYVQGG
jgi:hypothetical protein